ncbi:MAG: phosphotransferase, partial [Sciscionella sp.]
LLLHCVVDKGAVAERHAERLVELATHATPGSALAGSVTAACPQGWDAHRIVRAALGRDWVALEPLRTALPRNASQRAPVAGRAAAFARGLVRLVAHAVRLPGARGISVALLGPDGAGKSTLAAAIESSFWLPTRAVYMGLWRDNPDHASPWRQGIAAASRPIIAWRQYLTGTYHRARGRLVVFDRYSYDALIPPSPPLRWLKRIYFAVLARTCPRPNLVLILDVPAALAYRRRPEEDYEDLSAKREHYLRLAGRLSGAMVVPADRSRDVVRADVVDRIWQTHISRRRRRWHSLIDLLIAAARLRRGLGDRRRLMRQRSLVPAALRAAAWTSNPPDTASWLIHNALVSDDTRSVVIHLGPAGTDPAAVMKFAADPCAVTDGDARARGLLAALAAHPAEGDFPALLPTHLGEGVVGGQHFTVERAMPGIAASRALVDPAAAALALRTAATAIGRMHRRTAANVLVDDAVVERWIRSRLRMISQAGMWDSAIGRIAGHLEHVWSGRRVVTATVHGDYHLGNVIMTREFDQVTGIVDWEWMGTSELPQHDLVYLLLHTRMTMQHRELGDVLCTLFAGGTWSRPEQRILTTAGVAPGDSDTVDPDVLLLVWLRHVACSLTQNPAYARNPIWMRRNVSRVLHWEHRR